MEIWSVDRLEGDWAVLAGPGGRLELPLEELPVPLGEGDCLRRDAGGRW